MGTQTAKMKSMLVLVLSIAAVSAFTTGNRKDNADEKDRSTSGYGSGYSGFPSYTGYGSGSSYPSYTGYGSGYPSYIYTASGSGYPSYFYTGYGSGYSGYPSYTGYGSGYSGYPSYTGYGSG